MKTLALFAVLLQSIFRFTPTALDARGPSVVFEGTLQTCAVASGDERVLDYYVPGTPPKAAWEIHVLGSHHFVILPRVTERHRSHTLGYAFSSEQEPRVERAGYRFSFAPVEGSWTDCAYDYVRIERIVTNAAAQ